MFLLSCIQKPRPVLLSRDHDQDMYKQILPFELTGLYSTSSSPLLWHTLAPEMKSETFSRNVNKVDQKIEVFYLTRTPLGNVNEERKSERRSSPASLALSRPDGLALTGLL